jgi:hypothetical protein
MCGKSNPSELDECQFCGARLKPVLAAGPDASTPIKPGDQPIKRDTAEFEKVKPIDQGPIHPGEVPTKKDTGELEKALPGWLRSLRQGDEPAAGEAEAAKASLAAEPAAPEPSAPAAPPEADWLSGLGKVAARDEEVVPDWLAGLRTGAGPAPGATGGQAEESGLEGGAADWLSRLGGETRAETSPEPTTTTSPPSPNATAPLSSPVVGDEPDWLQSLKSMQPSPGAAEQGAAPVTPSKTPTPSGSLPDWLGDLEAKPAAPAEAPAASVPGWLSDLAVKTGAGPLQGEAPAPAEAQAGPAEAGAAPISADPGTGQLPDWLAGIEPAGGAGPGSASAFSSEESPPAVEGRQAPFAMESPDWLSQLKPEQQAEGDSEITQQHLEAGELPSWVQAMRPVEAVVGDDKSASPDESLPAESSGPLAGLQGVIPAGPGLGHLRKPRSYSSKLQVSENQQKYAAFLERLVMQEGDARSPSAAGFRSSRLWRWLIAALLLLVTGLPLITGLRVAPAWSLPPTDNGASTVLIDALPANAPVLIAFDYDPALSGEMEAVAAPVVDRLLAKGPRLSVISTNPTGMVLADHFFDTALLVDIYRYESGEHYAGLGYLPGGPAGLSALAADPRKAIQDPDLLGSGSVSVWSTRFLEGVNRLSDFGAILVLVDDAETGRAWVEQTSQALGSTPLLMIVSAQAAPMIRPYLDSGQVRGLVAGLLDAKAYEQAYARPAAADSYWTSWSLGLLAAGFLIVGGTAWNAFAGWRARRRGGEES